jgi:transposase
MIWARSEPAEALALCQRRARKKLSAPADSSSPNRLTTRLFRCQKCGPQHNANFVAAINLANRAAQAGLGGTGLLSTSLMLGAFNPSSASCRL